MKVIVGLGNPGSKYEKTRHNIGFIFCDMLAQELNLEYRKKFSALVAETNLGGEKVLVVKPQTFMNLSGQTVHEIQSFYKLKAQDFLVIQDDLDLKFGKIRIKQKSRSGGHNGIKDIINQLKTEEVLRIKFGILNEYKNNVRDFVLDDFSKAEQKEIENKYVQIEEIISKWVKTGKV